MIVAVGTRNPAKIEGVRRVFAEFFKEVDVQGVDARGVTRTQPIGLEQITEGALIRARFALSKIKGKYGVGIEAGIFSLGKDVGYLDHQQAVIMRPNGRFSVGHSSGFMLPAKMVQRMLKEGNELEHYAVEMTGISEVGDKEGIVYHLTRGTVNRTDLTEQCVRTALVPWLNASRFGY
ncbi:MAG: inosine/xanthosine triphosphatase [Thaumarchaeota archaeon]|nr:inosine/xanthosine triphosphatase [Nitrososphaerota archaeon]